MAKMIKSTFPLEATKRMDSETQTSNASSPTSPNAYSSTTFPTSPQPDPGSATAIGGVSHKANEGHMNPSLDGFEFETGKEFSGHLRFGVQKHRDCGDVPGAMAFADELFHDGRVMPLKLPPRLQGDGEFNKSPVSLPKPLRTVCRIPITRRGSWDGDFDPFMTALEKVKEGNRGKKGHHRRSRTYSLFSATPKCMDMVSADNSNKHFSKGDGSVEPMHNRASNHSGPLDFKGSTYARWVREQTREALSPKSSRHFPFGERVGSAKPEHCPYPSTSPEGKLAKNKSEKSKMQKVKAFLLRYASLGRHNSRNKKTEESS